MNKPHYKLYDVWCEHRPFGLCVSYEEAQEIKARYQEYYPDRKYYLRVWSHRSVFND